MSVKACSPPPIYNTAILEATSQAVMSNKLWPNNRPQGKPVVLSYYFLDGNDKQQAAVKNATQEWCTFAHLILEPTYNDDLANLRISFAPRGSWSTIGTDAQLVKDKTQPTMNLGWIDPDEPSEQDKAIILHQFGHALGMMHEHQSPARGANIHLNELAIYNYYRPLLTYDDTLVKTQVIDPYNIMTVSNFSELDLDSIMMYFMPKELNEECINIPVNLTLSKLDKAFMTLNYPSKKPKDGGMSITQALNIANVPNDLAGVILDLVDQEKYSDARSVFSEYNLGVMALSATNRSFLRSVHPTNHIQQEILDAVSKATQNPLFRAAVTNIASQVFIQRGIPTINSVPGSAQSNVRDAIGCIITNPAFAKTIHNINTELSGLETRPMEFRTIPFTPAGSS